MSCQEASERGLGFGIWDSGLGFRVLDSDLGLGFQVRVKP